MLRKSSHGWRIKREMAAIRTPSPRLNPVREPPGSPSRSAPLSSLSPLPPLFFYCQKTVPPASHFCFSRQTTIFPLSTGSVATGFSATSYYSNAPEPDPDPNSPDDFTHVVGPNPYVESLRESSVGVDDRREDDGEGFGRRRTLPEELSSTVVLLTCMSLDGTCDVYLLRQGLSREQVAVVSYLKPKEPYLQLWSLDMDTFESLMWNSKAVVNKLEVCRGHELRVAFEEAMKYGGKVANNVEGYPGYEFRVAKDDCAPRDEMQHDFLLSSRDHSNAPEPDPNSPDDFTHVGGLNPYVESLRESSVAVNDRREDDGEGFGRRRTLPEELSSTVVLLTCMSMDGTCDVFLLRQGLSREQVPVVRCLKQKEPYLQLWSLDVDTFESLMWNSKAVVNKLEVCRGHELRVAFEEAMKYGGKVANNVEGYPGYEFRVAKDDCAPRDLTLVMSLQQSTMFHVSALYGVEINGEDKDEDEDEDEDDVVDEGDEEDLEDMEDEDDWVSQFEIFIQEMRKESPTLMKTIVHERD